MGILKKSNIVWSEELIQDKLSRNFMSDSNIKFCAENLYIYEWESDLWIMTKSNVIYEFEIKISKADFKNDFKKKTKKHSILESKADDKLKPTYFYYAVPENLINKIDVPEYAGLIYMLDVFPYFQIIKQAPKLTEKKRTVEELNLLEKFYYNYRDWKHKTIIERTYNEELNNLIDSYQGKPDSEKKHYVKLLEEAKTNKTIAENEAQRADSYSKLYYEVNNELHKANRVINRLRDILEKNNIDYNFNDIITEIYGF